MTESKREGEIEKGKDKVTGTKTKQRKQNEKYYAYYVLLMSTGERLCRVADTTPMSKENIPTPPPPQKKGRRGKKQ